MKHSPEDAARAIESWLQGHDKALVIGQITSASPGG